VKSYLSGESRDSNKSVYRSGEPLRHPKAGCSQESRGACGQESKAVAVKQVQRWLSDGLIEKNI
jgi:hypothetical protein